MHAERRRQWEMEGEEKNKTNGLKVNGIHSQNTHMLTHTHTHDSRITLTNVSVADVCTCF